MIIGTKNQKSLLCTSLEKRPSLLKNAYTDEICTLYVLHLRSVFEIQTQTDEATRSFSTRWCVFCEGDNGNVLIRSNRATKET